MKKLKDKKLLALIICIAILILVLVGIIFGCSKNNSSKSEKEPSELESVITEEIKKDKNNDEEKEKAVVENSTENADEKENNVVENSTEDTEEKSDKENKLAEKETPKKNDSNEQTKTDTSASDKTTNDNTTTNTHTHTWVAVYKTVNHPTATKQVWVVDKAAYTEEVPIYETKYVNVCSEKSCAISFHGWTFDEIDNHMYNHMIKGENGGYHKEDREVLTGYKTVTHPEEGHYNTVVVKEAYTEEVLSGYKCSCGATK